MKPRRPLKLLGHYTFACKCGQVTLYRKAWLDRMVSKGHVPRCAKCKQEVKGRP